MWKVIIVFFLFMLVVVYVFESLVSIIEIVLESFGWSELFIGVIIVVIVGNVVEYVLVIIMVVKNCMGVVVEIVVGFIL